MAPIEALPPEIVSYIADLSIWRPKKKSTLRNYSAWARASRHFYAILNPLLYEHSLKHQPPFKSCVLWAIKRDNLETLKKAHFYGADLNADLDARPGRSRCLFTPLHLAIRLDCMAIFNYLLDEGVDLELPSQHICSCMIGGDVHMFPLHTALAHAAKTPKYAEILISKGCYRVTRDSPALPYIENLDAYGDSVAELIERPDPFALAASLHHAVRKNKPDLVRDLLKRRGADITYTFATKQTALHFALQHITKDLEIIKLLLNHPGINLSAADNQGVRPLDYCVTRPELLDAAKLLVTHPDIQISHPNRAGATPLHLAAQSGSVTMFNLLACQPGVDFSVADGDGKTVLHLVLEHMAENADIAKFVLQQPGISASATTNDGVTPLHLCASSPPLVKVAKLILTHPGVQPHVSDRTGATPLLNAAKSGFMPMFKLLFDQPGLRISAADNRRVTALHICASSPALLEATKLLLAHPDIDVSSLDDTGKSPLVYAATSGSPSLFTLVASHPGVNLVEESDAALYAACNVPETQDTKSIVAFLLNNADRGEDSDDLGIALHHAIARKNFEIALLLLSRGADPNCSVETAKMWSALHYCLEKPHPLQEQLLEEILAGGVGADDPSLQGEDSSANTDDFPTDGTPLFFALVGAKNIECMKILLKAGADPDAMATCVEGRDDTERGAEQTMIAALCRHLWRTYDSEYLTEQSIQSVKEGVILLLECGSSIGEVGGGVSALQFAADAAHYNNNWPLLNLLLEHATRKNIHPDDIQKVIDGYKTADNTTTETIITLSKFQDELLKGGRGE